MFHDDEWVLLLNQCGMITRYTLIYPPYAFKLEYTVHCTAATIYTETLRSPWINVVGSTI